MRKEKNQIGTTVVISEITNNLEKPVKKLMLKVLRLLKKKFTGVQTLIPTLKFFFRI